MWSSSLISGTAIFSDICNVRIDDDVSFDITKIEDIRETDDYPGIRVSLLANYPPISVPLTVDVTTGDKITPKEIEYTFSLMFDDRTLSVLAYNLETVLAEKIETILSRSIANTRPRDFYDIHILYTLRGDQCDPLTLRQALERTAQKRGSTQILTNYPAILTEIRESRELQTFWTKYQKSYDYAREISFEDTCRTIEKIINQIFSEWTLINSCLQFSRYYVIIEPVRISHANTFKYGQNIGNILATKNQLTKSFLNN